ncbi:MAG: DegV family protein [Clostridia bacterium]|nr:DegV family protein [Clostridia bacterium]
MRDIKIIADSGSCLDAELCRRTGAISIPLTLTVDGRDFIDTMDLDVVEFLEATEASPNVAHSACPSPAAYAAAYEGSEEVYVFTLSSKLSGSYQSAMAAKDLASNGDKVHVFDSWSACGGPALQVVWLKRLIDQGLSREQIIEDMERFIREMHTLFVLEDLNPMIKNGRMNRLVGKLVMAMQIRPILDADEGEVIQIDKARGTKAALKRLTEIAVEQAKRRSCKVAMIAHCFNPEGAAYAKSILEEQTDLEEILIVQTNGLNTLYAARNGLVISL